MTKSIINIIILLALVLITGLCVWGAFLGSARAGAIAGSLPVLIPGVLLIGLFVLSFFQFPRLFGRPGLLMIHIGCVAVLVGGIYGGSYGHLLRMQELPANHSGPAKYGKVYKSLLRIDEGDYADSLYAVGDDGMQYVSALGYKLFLKDFEIQYYDNGQIKDFISHLMIIADNGQHFGPYAIEVNKPLYFGGYHFYQNNYDQASGSFTVLKVVSADGLWLVYAGYFLLLSGVFWHLWLRPALQWHLKAKELANV